MNAPVLADKLELKGTLKLNSREMVLYLLKQDEKTIKNKELRYEEYFCVSLVRR